MSGRLPDHVDFMRLARQGQVLDGDLCLVRMQRLSVSLCNTQGSARVRLVFDLDERRRPILRAQVEARLVLECQRCLGGVSYPVSAETVYGLLEHAAQAERLPQVYEPLLLAAGPMSPLELVEDELILALPAVARHEDGDPACRPCTRWQRPDESIRTAVVKDHPFAALSRLKK